MARRTSGFLTIGCFDVRPSDDVLSHGTHLSVLVFARSGSEQSARKRMSFLLRSVACTLIMLQGRIFWARSNTDFFGIIFFQSGGTDERLQLKLVDLGCTAYLQIRQGCK